MSKYDDLFAETNPTDSVFADKSALDPLTPSEEIIARENHERALMTILNSIHEGYLPPAVSIHGPPGTGKTMTTRLGAEEVVVEYVHLKECRTIFSAANEILLALGGEKRGLHVGMDSVSERSGSASRRIRSGPC